MADGTPQFHQNPVGWVSSLIVWTFGGAMGSAVGSSIQFLDNHAWAGPLIGIILAAVITNGCNIFYRLYSSHWHSRAIVAEDKLKKNQQKIEG